MCVHMYKIYNSNKLSNCKGGLLPAWEMRRTGYSLLPLSSHL